MYRPQADTRLLARAVAGAGIPASSHVLDVCTGTGALAIAAARLPVKAVTAVDISRTALASAWLNCRVRGIRPELVHGDFRSVLHGRTFDVIVSNPPYVPCPEDEKSTGAARCWNGGVDGRAPIDALCARVPDLLSVSGTFLMVHSTLCGVDETLDRLRTSGLKAATVARETIPFGPVMRDRASWLAARGLIRPRQTYEELVVIRADRPRK
ncbi:HemK2/MTQ2 family protein methyltransferase [Nocardia yunnanensis]|uniref:HemK2/MTQ2 family protein methyltransferase n=1 Tax=Nocardia yunnanensis TaxID=2382165 RepID=UPI001FE8D633|nr:HemK2/MTQ2 family protein methyltransferase [Nocardia yunnanensis]